MVARLPVALYDVTKLSYNDNDLVSTTFILTQKTKIFQILSYPDNFRLTISHRGRTNEAHLCIPFFVSHTSVVYCISYFGCLFLNNIFSLANFYVVEF